MLFQTTTLLLVLGSTLPTAYASICSRSPYNIFLDLARFPVAQAYCTSNYPLLHAKTTLTAPSKSETVTVATTTLDTTVAIAVVTTTVETATVTTAWSTWTSTESTTVFKTTATEDAGATHVNDPTSIFSKMLSQPPNLVSAACSCIEKMSTSSIWVTPTSTAKVTASVFASAHSTSVTEVTATTTTSVLDTITLTTTITSKVAFTCPTDVPTFCSSKGCIDTSSDDANCGSCGTVCSAEQSCSKGKCVEAYRPPPTCDNPGAFCSSAANGDACFCYHTVEGNGTCAEYYGTCGPPCKSSEDCGSGSACLSSLDQDCGYDICTTPSDSSCVNEGSAKRMFQPRGRRDPLAGGKFRRKMYL